LGQNDRLFLHHLLENPDAMVNYVGDPHTSRRFSDARNWLIFKVMEGLFIEHGTIEFAWVLEVLADRGLLDLAGGRKHLDHIVQHHVPDWLWNKSNYQEWRASLHEGDE
jgi:replicative DNA helicase